ncbi:hypothetical protein LMG7141_03218 [Ralstonia condita]|uniref:Uncharacterized protein n=1 Tax=Ralstonia condita TaxID=3058600 RepID=A0ABN9J394_9RALS|nr:hypothetical protein LMG7141_03218 [Ralstonia sp. LMG 7141]
MAPKKRRPDARHRPSPRKGRRAVRRDAVVPCRYLRWHRLRSDTCKGYANVEQRVSAIRIQNATRRAFFSVFRARSSACVAFCSANGAQSSAREAFCSVVEAQSSARETFSSAVEARSSAREAFCSAIEARSSACEAFSSAVEVQNSTCEAFSSVIEVRNAACEVRNTARDWCVSSAGVVRRTKAGRWPGRSTGHHIDHPLGGFH